MRKRKKNYKFKFISGGLCVCAVCVCAGLFSYQKSKEEARYQKHLQQLDERIQDEQERAQDIEAYRDYVGTDEYVEEVARDKLGLVYKDEILLKPNEK